MFVLVACAKNFMSHDLYLMVLLEPNLSASMKRVKGCDSEERYKTYKHFCPHCKEDLMFKLHKKVSEVCISIMLWLEYWYKWRIIEWASIEV